MAEKVPENGSQTVPLTVYVKDGKIVQPGEGERVVIGEAVVDKTGTRLFIDECSDEVKASLATDDGASLSIGHIFREEH